MMEYSSGLTSEGWFQNEMIIVLQLKLDGLSRNEIVTQITEKNLFQMRSESAIKKRYQMVYRRSETLNTDLAAFYITGSRLDQKALLLYSYLKTYRFPYEFFMEVILYNYRKDKTSMQSIDLDFFMERKESESVKVAGWRPETKKRLRSSIIMFLRESGLIQETGPDTYNITPLHMNAKLKEYARDNDKLLHILSELK